VQLSLTGVVTRNSMRDLSTFGEKCLLLMPCILQHSFPLYGINYADPILRVTDCVAQLDKLWMCSVLDFDKRPAMREYQYYPIRN